MPNQNVEIIRRFYELWLAGDPAGAARETFDPEIELHPAPEGQEFFPDLEEVYRGPGGVARYMAMVWESFDDYRAQVEDLLDVGDRVVTLAVESARGKFSGAQVQTRQTAHVWILRDGRAVRLELYWDRAQGLAAAGLD